MAALTRDSGYVAEQRRGPRIDWLLILATTILIVVGFMSLYSEGLTHDGLANFRTQIRNTVIGLLPFAIFAFTPPRIWYRVANLIYAVNIATLMLVLVHGAHKKGAERWIQLGPIQFQPSEMAKILLVLTLAAFYAKRQDSIRSPATFGLGLLHVSVPAILVLAQPHLGATMVLMVIWFAVSVIAGVPAKFLAIAVATVLVVGGGLVWAISIPNAPKFLPTYQVKRLLGMSVDDAKGKNYQTDRAAIAFAVGGVQGVGWKNGEQKAGHFIPEQHDDFIFTVVGEEGGLIGCTLVLAAYGFFFYRLWLIMFFATDAYYKSIIAGLFAALGFHMFVNIGMVLHILPVVGLWLPFLSYGGTAMWMCMSCVGLALAIKAREKPLLF
jgi:rod shape determining protein RodA